ncbi:MAG TPA: DUF309 domain-containing protein [Gemmataceae bacterium]|nr:DUF309 domain-containing protein [Gemmataceae bacterium]
MVNPATPNRQPIPRLAPDRPFPSYTYVPGRSPHPVSDPRGHSYGSKPDRPQPPNPERWRSCQPYLFGIDLFNQGFYWEAHEVWEGLWHACGRSGPMGCFLKGLIHLAAAGVKVREGILQGVTSHARRALELFQQTASHVGTADTHYLGLHLGELMRWAQTIASAAIAEKGAVGPAAFPVFDFVLFPA